MSHLVIDLGLVVSDLSIPQFCSVAKPLLHNSDQVYGQRDTLNLEFGNCNCNLNLLLMLEESKYLCSLVHSLIGKRARAGDDAHASAPMDVTRHDSNLALKFKAY